MLQVGTQVEMIRCKETKIFNSPNLPKINVKGFVFSHS